MPTVDHRLQIASTGSRYSGVNLRFATQNQQLVRLPFA